MAMDEFQLIRHHFSRLTTSQRGVALGIGDDCALLQIPPGFELAVTTDTLVEGRHFPSHASPYDIGWKALAVNLSDLAAMGAEPHWFTLALTLPEPDSGWLAEFGRGLKALAEPHHVALVGGDTTRGALSLTITAMGLVPNGRAIKRSNAQAGDWVCVTGTLGDAALALGQLHDPALPDALRLRLHRPQPRVQAGLALRDFAHAAIDLSDGLAGDLDHILQASGVGAVIQAAQLPMSSEFERLAPAASRLALQAQGGDDYELCFCIAPDQLDMLRAATEVPIQVVGVVTDKPGLRFVDAEGVTIPMDSIGYRHFA
jgi:thiamine-monophosphate kinase